MEASHANNKIEVGGRGRWMRNGGKRCRHARRPTYRTGYICNSKHGLDLRPIPLLVETGPTVAASASLVGMATSSSVASSVVVALICRLRDTAPSAAIKSIAQLF
jgi:hypothetical protein